MISFNYTQVSASTSWAVNHDLDNLYPNIDVMVDVSGTLTKALPLNVVANNANTVTITFTQAQSGHARITA